MLERRLSPNPLVTIHKYPGADHAFARHGGKTYSKPEADRALGLTVDFFKRASVKVSCRHAVISCAPKARTRRPTRKRGICFDSGSCAARGPGMTELEEGANIHDEARLFPLRNRAPYRVMARSGHHGETPTGSSASTISTSPRPPSGACSTSSSTPSKELDLRAGRSRKSGSAPPMSMRLEPLTLARRARRR